MANLYMMIGLPGSGKSTYAKETLLKFNPDWGYVSRDEVRFEMIDDVEHYFDKEDDVFREFCNRIEMYLLRGQNVIADATHLNAKSRLKLIKALKTKPSKIYAVYINTPFDVCMERNKERTGLQLVPDQAMYNMQRRFKAPSHDEGFETIYMVH